jgi:DNA (cytosine-5)-methyltransferase 1
MNVLDLFSGIGGFSLGLERAGFTTVAFCEREPFCQQILSQHWPGVPVYDDVQTLTAERLKADGVETVDLICGGFPCQDISLAGKGAGLSGERSGLWFEFHRLIQELRPRFVIAENVSALRSRGLDAVLRSLAEIGYDAEWHCIPASAVGAPHRRDRIWIVAYPNGFSCKGFVTGSSGEGFSQRSSDDFAPCGSALAYAARELPHRTGPSGQAGWFQSSDGGSSVAHPGNSGLEGQRIRASCAGAEISMPASIRCVVRGVEVSRQWDAEPDVGRVANGIPRRVDRLKALGNAVVPQIPEMIGRAIMAAERPQLGQVA